MDGEWSPWCDPPAGLVAPVRARPRDKHGPSVREAYGPRWRRTGPGLFVPAATDEAVVEQRILEQAARLGPYGALTGWAALRWRGAAYFDGTARGDRQVLPVPLAVGRACLRPDPAVEVIRRQLPSDEWAVVRGVRCSIAARALFDEVIRLGSARPAAVAIDMAVAGELLAVAEFWTFLKHIGPRNGVVLAREAASLACGTHWSPQEAWMCQSWCLDAGLPKARYNVPVFDRHGNLLGIPDLFDADAGVVGEYQGAVHRDAAQHRRDVERAEGFRAHRLEYFEVVAGEMSDGVLVAKRMRDARDRALFLPPDARTWTLDQPSWWLTRHQERRAS